MAKKKQKTEEQPKAVDPTPKPLGRVMKLWNVPIIMKDGEPTTVEPSPPKAVEPAKPRYRLTDLRVTSISLTGPGISIPVWRAPTEEEKARYRAACAIAKVMTPEQIGAFAVRAAGPAILHSPDYTTVVYGDRCYVLSEKESQVAQVLIAYHAKGTPYVRHENVAKVILGTTGRVMGRLVDEFTTPDGKSLYREVLSHPDRKGVVGFPL